MRSVDLVAVLAPPQPCPKHTSIQMFKHVCLNTHLVTQLDTQPRRHEAREWSMIGDDRGMCRRDRSGGDIDAEGRAIDVITEEQHAHLCIDGVYSGIHVCLEHGCPTVWGIVAWLLASIKA